MDEEVEVDEEVAVDEEVIGSFLNIKSTLIIIHNNISGGYGGSRGG